MKNNYYLGIDTSNYKTSIALINDDGIVSDIRRFLSVKPGEKGLRQSEALFQHVKALPELMDMLKEECDGIRDGLKAVAYSSRPRPVEGSYMPCFLAGESVARSIAASMNVPVLAVSHQEGHLAAAGFGADMPETDSYIACHFSGGTCEILNVSKDGIDIIGGSGDISFGQILDRLGVMYGMTFPCGQELDEIAINAESATNVLTSIKVKNMTINISGVENQLKKAIESDSSQVNSALVRELFDIIAKAICKMLLQASESADKKDILMTGGVASSRYLREKVSEHFAKTDINVYFDNMNLSSDNAVGVALLGRKYIWDLNR